MATPRRPNGDLRKLITEASWTEEALARAVNKLAAEVGLHLRYDRTAVSHWLSGMRPRAPVPSLVAEAFERRLGRPVTTADVGLSPVSAQRASEDPGTVLAGLASAQTGTRARDGAVRKAWPYSLTALAVPAWARELPAGAGPAVTGALITEASVDGAEAMAQVFSASDAAFGGGMARRALAAYLASDVGPRLAAPARPAIRCRLYSAAAELAYLCGFMCFDDELSGLSQRYYLAALRLAAEAGDQCRYSLTLRAMSVQALRLSQHRHAVHLAEAAAATGRVAGLGRRAFLYSQLAVAHAAERDRINALASLTAAERYLEGATSSSPIGAYNSASLAHTQAKVRALLGDHKGASSALVVSLRNRPRAERRARVITLASLAEIQLCRGHLDEAVATWQAFLDDYPSLACGRADNALKTMRAKCRPYTRNPAARALLDRTSSFPASAGLPGGDSVAARDGQPGRDANSGPPRLECS
jgi:hypothetical protein